jgi:hypothetical protein
MVTRYHGRRRLPVVGKGHPSDGWLLATCDDLRPFDAAVTSQREFGQGNLAATICDQLGEVETRYMVSIDAQSVRLTTVL